MKIIINISVLIFLCSFFCNQKSFAQQSTRLQYLSYVFPLDSLNGFNEVGSNNDALTRGFFGIEYKVYMYRAKRNFIDKKYGYSPAPSMNANAKGPSAGINAAPCVNEDFEASPVGLVTTLTGWAISEGSNTGSCIMGGCCPTTTGIDAWVRTTPYASGSLIGTIPNSPLGGTKVLQMNDNLTNQGEVIRIQQTFPVTSTNALFQLAYMAEMDGSGHVCCDQPYLKLTILDCSNNPLACPSLSLNAPGASCASAVPAGWFTNASGISWTTAWQMYSLDLTPYLGSCLTVQITMGDCSGWAHHGMAYVDMLCSPMTIVVNNISFPVGSASTVSASACTGIATVSAPPGLQPYLWNGPAGSGVTNNANQTFTTTVGGNYTLTMTPPGSCSPIIRIVTLSFGTSPVAGLTTTNSCTTFSFTNTGTGPPAVQTYSFIGVGPPPSFTTTATTTVVNFPPSSTYTVIQTITNAAGCTASVQSVVVTNPLPTPNIITNSPICIGKDINLSATGGTAFVWGGPNSFSGANATQTIAAAGIMNSGTYTVTVTDANGCVNFTTANVTVNPQPIVVASGTTVCENSNAQLTAGGGVSYAWSGPGGYVSGVQNPVIFNASMTSVGQYTVFITDANTCTNTAVANISVNPAPTPSIVTNSPICVNDIMNLTATGGITYAWSGPNGFTSSVQSPTVLGTSTAVGGIYQVTVTNASGCFATTTVNTIVNPNPVPQITSGPNTGCAPLCVTYTVQSTPTASLAYWTFGNGESANGVLTSMACYNTAGIYTVNATVSDANGCLGSTTYTAEVYPVPVADFNHAPIKPIINIDGEVVFTDASYGANIVTWNWYFMNTAQFTSVQQNPTFLYTEPGTYVVALVVKSDKGCMDTLLRPLVVGEDFGIYVPNAFTPNSDGFNDVFQPKGFGIVKYTLYIFDRWGEKVFYTKVFEEAWDGTFQGRGHKGCEEAVYTWLINVTDVFGKAHELKGHVTLIR